MTELQQKSIIDPELTDVLMQVKQDVFATLNCVKVGEINSYDATDKTAEIQLLFKRVLPDGSIQSYPVLVDCPVVTLQGGGGAIQFPVAEGDQCVVLFSDRRLDEWFQNGGEAAPGDARMHDLSDGIALVGLNALNSDLPATPSDKVVLIYQGSKIELDGSGVKLIGVGGAEIDLQTTLATIRNGTTTLLTLLDGLIDVIAALQVNGPIPLTAASIASLTAYKAQLATLLG